VQDAEKNSHHGEALQAVSSGGRMAAVGWRRAGISEK